jgi:predicted O-linked N-acetylglucosamine transferase (SPINDLY family)
MNRKERRQGLARARTKAVPGDDASLTFRDAVLYLQAGELDESERAHRRVLEKLPRHAPSLHHLGLIAFKRNAYADAVGYVRQSVAADPKYHQAWLNLAIILGEMRRSEEAIAACRQCMALQPQSADAYAVLGNLLRVAENFNAAAAAYADSLRLNPAQPDVLVGFAELLLQSGETTGALERCRKALEIDPAYEPAQNLERRIMTSAVSLDAAQALMEAQAKSPAELAKNLDQLGAALSKERRYQEAVAVYRRAIQLEPDKADWIFNLALCLDGLGQKEEAFASYQAGLAIDPDRAGAYVNVGVLLRSMEMHTGAIQAFEQAIKLDPDLGVAHYNLAVTLKLGGRYKEARAAFAKAVALEPDALAYRFEFANMRRILCDWDGLDAEDERCLEALRQRAITLAPFNLISMPASRADQLEIGRRCARLATVPEADRFKTHHNALGAGQRIRIGFLSSDFFEHATTMLLVEVLESIDRKRFELFGYCHSPSDGSSLRHRIVCAFEHFISVGLMRDQDAARTIHADGIDILVDLKGYTKDARTGIFAHRPAPIQVNYLGYPGTMGADFIDYILADSVVAPMEHQGGYSERIVHLPNCYQPNDRRREIDSEPVTRAEFGLPEDAFVFCSFNSSYKINPTMFDIWMPLLQSVPGSVLWLLVTDDVCRENLKREAARRGVDPDRIVFAGRLPIAKHLARHRLADLFLDSLPCNAHTTTSDALWAGLPVLTCVGETFAGRVAASLLTAMELPELITGSLEEYAERALALARDKNRLEEIKRKISVQCQRAPLFDTQRFTRNLERSFETMVAIMRSGEAPCPFVVTEDESMPHNPER